jgi:hypothetical protein
VFVELLLGPVLHMNERDCLLVRGRLFPDGVVQIRDPGCSSTHDDDQLPQIAADLPQHKSAATGPDITNICELELERSQGAVAGTSRCEHGFGANHELRSVVCTLTMPVAPSVRFLLRLRFAHLTRTPARSLLGRSSAMSLPRAHSQGRPYHQRCAPPSLP